MMHMREKDRERQTQTQTERGRHRHRQREPEKERAKDTEDKRAKKEVERKKSTYDGVVGLIGNFSVGSKNDSDLLVSGQVVANGTEDNNKNHGRHRDDREATGH